MGSGKRAPGEPGLAAEAGWFALVMASVVHGSVAPLLAGVPVGPALAAAAAVAALLYAAFRHGTGALFCSAVFCNELGRWAADGDPGGRGAPRPQPRGGFGKRSASAERRGATGLIRPRHSTRSSRGVPGDSS